MRSLDKMNLELSQRNHDLEAIINERDLRFNELQMEYDRLERDIQNNVNNAIGFAMNQNPIRS
jgi:hypothetical protein